MRKKFILCFLLNIKNNGKEMNVIIIDNGKGINGSEVKAFSLITRVNVARSINNGIGIMHKERKKRILENFFNNIVAILLLITIHKTF